MLVHNMYDMHWYTLYIFNFVYLSYPEDDAHKKNGFVIKEKEEDINDVFNDSTRKPERKGLSSWMHFVWIFNFRIH